MNSEEERLRAENEARKKTYDLLAESIERRSKTLLEREVLLMRIYLGQNCSQELRNLALGDLKCILDSLKGK